MLVPLIVATVIKTLDEPIFCTESPSKLCLQIKKGQTWELVQTRGGTVNQQVVLTFELKIDLESLNKK